MKARSMLKGFVFGVLFAVIIDFAADYANYLTGYGQNGNYFITNLSFLLAVPSMAVYAVTGMQHNALQGLIRSHIFKLIVNGLICGFVFAFSVFVWKTAHDVGNEQK